MSDEQVRSEGIHGMSAEMYHGDPCSAPSLSSSIAKILCQESPLHAWTAHPRLNPNFIREEKDHFDVGSIAHALVLQGESVAEVLEFPDWRKDAAREARDKARAEGKVPILRKNWDSVQAMVKAFNLQVLALRDPFFIDKGEVEQTLVWQEENGVWCRARLDWLSTDRKQIVDYKTTGATANPEVVSRTLFDNGYDIQEAFYRRGVRAVFGTDPRFRFFYQETHEPYALSVLSCGPDIQFLAEKKILYAIEIFGRCLESGRWRGFPRETCFASLPDWREAQWLEKELKEVS